MANLKNINRFNCKNIKPKYISMRHIFIICMVTSLTIFNFEVKAQNAENPNDFINKIEAYLNKISKSTNDVFYSKGLINRKIKLNGKFDNGSKSFKQKIKYYRGGGKKEKIKVKLLAPKKALKLLKIILINGDLFYVNYYSYFDEDIYKMKLEEILIDGKIYKRIEYNSKGENLKSQSIWNFKTKE